MIILDFSKNKEDKLLYGIENGICFIKKYKINEKIKFIDNNKVVISNSFFYGMFHGMTNKFKTKKELLDNCDINELTRTNQKEFIRGANRFFSTTINSSI